MAGRPGTRKTTSSVTNVKTVSTSPALLAASQVATSCRISCSSFCIWIPSMLSGRPGSRGYTNTSDDSRTGKKGVQHPSDMGKVRDADKIAGSVETDQVAHPGEDGHIRDRVGVAHDPRAVREPRVEHLQQAPRLRDVAVACPLVFVVLAGEPMEEADLTEHRADTAHLKHQPLDRLVAVRRILRHEPASLVRQIDQNRSGFEQRASPRPSLRSASAGNRAGCGLDSGPAISL